MKEKLSKSNMRTIKITSDLPIVIHQEATIKKACEIEK